MNKEKEFESLIQLIEDMPPMAPPDDFTDRVMENLAPKRLSFWKKVYRKTFTPTTISFTPGKLIPSAVAVMALFFVLIKVSFVGPFHPQRQAALDADFVPVTFALQAESAREVAVIGSFNNWEPRRHEMQFDRQSNQWILKVMLPPGQYEYAFLINGEKVIPDPKATFNRSDGFGSQNSVIFTGNPSGLHL